MGKNTEGVRFLPRTKIGGERIRTSGTLTDTPVFKTGAFSRSATPPVLVRGGLTYLFYFRCLPLFRHETQILILLPEDKRAHWRLGFLFFFPVGLNWVALTLLL